MSRHRYTLTEELDPQDITDISEGHKKTLIERGLRPFRTSHGRIVWANDSTRLYKLSRSNPFKGFRLFAPKSPRINKNRIRRGGRRSALAYFLKDNIWMILILMAVAALVVAVLKYQFLIG